jgi:NAD(P)-dependent dehydrogenase (short-subunit alcohol dehydrogenase family)
MLTLTTQQVLEPIADTISRLILLYSNAEIANSPLPDLTNVAISVDEQVESLINVGKEAMIHKSADEILKDQMPKACNESNVHQYLLDTYLFTLFQKI